MHHQPVSAWAQGDLATQTRAIILRRDRAIKQVFLTVTAAAGDGRPGRINIAMAGGAHHPPATFTDDTVQTSVHGQTHDTIARLARQNSFNALGGELPDLDHVTPLFPNKPQRQLIQRPHGIVGPPYRIARRLDTIDTLDQLCQQRQLLRISL